MLTSRRKSIRVMGRLTRNNERSLTTAIAEIEHDLTNLKHVHDHDEAQQLVVEIVEAQRLLTYMNQPMTEMKMKLLLLQYMTNPMFDSITSEINKHDRWSFTRAREELEDSARHYRLRQSKQPNTLENFAVKKHRQDIDQLLIAATTAAATVSNEWTTHSPDHVECFNCKNKGHMAKDCLASFCSRCKTFWPSILHPQYHNSAFCPSAASTSRGRGGRYTQVSRGGRSDRGTFRAGRNPVTRGTIL